MIVAVDASALVAIILREPERDSYLDLLAGVETAYISPVTLVEARIAVRRNGGDRLLAELEALVATRPFIIAPTTTSDAALAWTAFLAYGKGSGSGAKLNLGDLFSYALAKVRDVPLLYKGDDFVRTDIRTARHGA